MFVNLGSDMCFTTTELNAERAGEVYSELGEELGVRPHSSGVNSGRRNAAVLALSQGLDKEGMGQMMVKKLMQHRTSQRPKARRRSRRSTTTRRTRWTWERS